MSNFRVSSIERDLSGFISARTNETGAMILESIKGKNEPILCETEDDVIINAGYPSASYPSVFEALAFVRKAPLYIVCPYASTSVFGGVDVKQDGVHKFNTGRVDPDNFTYTSVNTSGTLTIGTANGVETNFTGTISDTPVEEGSITIKSNGTDQNVTDADEVITGDTLSAGTIDYDTGALDITFDTAPTSGSAITCEYVYNTDLSSDVSHSFFAASPGVDELSVSIEYVSSTKFKMSLYKIESALYVPIAGYDEIEYSLTREKNGYGKSIYIMDVFEDDPYVIPVVNSDYEGSYDAFDSTYVDFNGGNRVAPESSDITTGWAYFNKKNKYPVYIIMDVLGGYYTTVNNIIQNYQNYAHALTIIPFGNDVSDAIDYRSSMSVDSDNLSIYFNWMKIEDTYNNSYAWISNIGSIGGKFAMMQDIYDSGSPAGIDEDGHGGQLSDWKYVESEEDVSDNDRRLLDEAQINPVIFDETYGVLVEGDRTAQVSNSDTSFIGTRRAYNFLIDTVSKQVLRKQVFKNNDEDHRTRARVMIDDFISSTLGAVGAFREWYVQSDSANNTDAILDQRRFIVDVYVKATPNSQFVQLRLTRVAQTTVLADVIPS